jgi:hypothetical protein
MADYLFNAISGNHLFDVGSSTGVVASKAPCRPLEELPKG